MSSLHVEIQNLRDALAASERKVDRYAHMVATLSVELDDLRNGICHSCKRKLASGSASMPQITISTSQGPTVSAPSWRRVFQGGRQRSRPRTDNASSIRPSHSLIAAPPNTNKPLPVPYENGVADNLSSSQTTPTPTHPGPSENIFSSEQKHTPPKWSVVYNPEVERALELHLVHTFTYDALVYGIHMSPNGQRLAVGNEKTYLHELQNGSNICVLVDRYVKDRVSIRSVKFSPNGRLLATGASDHQIRIWDVAIKRMRAMLKGHKHSVHDVAFSPNGHSLVSASADHSARIWNLRDGSSKVLPVTGSPSVFSCVVFSPDGRYVAGGNLNGMLWIWDSRTHRLVTKWQGRANNPVWCTKFTPGGKGLVSCSDKTVQYWDVSSLGNRQGVSMRTEESGFPLVRNFVGHNGPVYSVALFHDDDTRWIVSGSQDQSVRVWDTESGVCQLTLQGHMDWVRGVDVSRTQNFLATASDDGRVMVWKYKLL